MKGPTKYYRLAITATLCISWCIGVIAKAPPEAWLPLGLLGATALGSTWVERWQLKK